MVPPSHLDKEVFFAQVWPQTSSHFILFFGLACVGHHLCVELYQGRSRVYQAFFQEYTAYEWATCSGRAAAIPACQLRGGGHEMDWGETKVFFDQLFELMHPIVFLPESQLQFSYPELQAHRFCFLYEALTGVPASATPFLCMLLHLNWRAFGAQDERGRPAPVGWTVQGGTVTKEKGK